MSVPQNPAAGWYPDPTRPGYQRWWTGVAWSDSVQPSEVQPAVAPPAAGYGPQAPYAAPQQYSYGAPQSPAQPAYWAGSSAGLVPPGRPMGFGEAITAVFRSYATFGGRASRSEFWYWTLFCGLVLFVLYIPISVVQAFDGSSLDWIAGFLSLPLTGFFFAILIPTLAVTVRRLRDAGLPWPLIFLDLVPYLGAIVVLILCAQSAKPWPLPRV